jgi:hypothetical protein
MTKNKGGRPKYKDIPLCEAENVFNNKYDFDNEKKLCNFIEKNIKIFAKEILNISDFSYERESYISLFNKPAIKQKTGNKSRVDFKIIEKSGIHLIECKNPKNTQRELNRSISQILDYIITAESFNKKVLSSWLVTSKIHYSLTKIIERFNLRINILLLNKKELAIWRCGDGK